MRADLQALVNAPPIATGHERQNKMMVLAWLYMMKFAPNINFNIPTLVNKVAGMQGVTDVNMLDLQIGGLATLLGYGNYTWAQLKPVAAAAINGQGVNTGTVPAQAAITSPDYQTLINYALLTNAKILNDAS